MNSSAVDKTLQQGLAKMLPGILEVWGVYIIWTDSKGRRYKPEVRETEWLHVCWLVEQELYKQGILAEHYAVELDKIVPRRGLVGSHLRSTAARQFELLNASWQQRSKCLLAIAVTPTKRV